MRDTTALGGLALYVFIAALFLLLGYFGMFVELAIALVLMYACISIVRLMFFRVRPDRQKYHNWLSKIDAGSFPSMHSMRAGTLAVLLAAFFADYAVGTLLVLGVLAVVFTRVALRRHYWIDVLAGLVLSAPIAWLAMFLTPFVLDALGV